MSLNIDINKLDCLETDLKSIKDNTSSTYDEITSLSSTISGNWSSEGSDAFINKYDNFSKNFDDYNEAINSINKYITSTKENYIETKEKVEETLD